MLAYIPDSVPPRGAEDEPVRRIEVTAQAILGQVRSCAVRDI